MPAARKNMLGVATLAVGFSYPPYESDKNCVVIAGHAGWRRESTFGFSVSPGGGQPRPA